MLTNFVSTLEKLVSTLENIINSRYFNPLNNTWVLPWKILNQGIKIMRKGECCVIGVGDKVNFWLDK